MKTKSYIEQWLAHPGADRFFGRRFTFKFSVLAKVTSGTGGTLAEIARRYGVSRQAASKHANAARRIFGLRNP